MKSEMKEITKGVFLLNISEYHFIYTPNEY